MRIPKKIVTNRDALHDAAQTLAAAEYQLRRAVDSGRLARVEAAEALVAFARSEYQGVRTLALAEPNGRYGE